MNRRLKIGMLLCCLLPSVTFAQNREIVIRDERSITGSEQSLIVVDGKIYEGDLKTIFNKIKGLSILTGANSGALFGSSGVNGVMIIDTKKAKNKLSYLRDTSFNQSAIYIQDGILSNKVTTKSGEVLTKDVLKEESLDRTYSDNRLDSIVVIITKSFAKKQYQKRFSSFSKTCKTYLKAHQNKEDDFLYIVNGVPVEGKDNDEIIRKLYEITAKKLKTVDFLEKNSMPLYNATTMVVITTKK